MFASGGINPSADWYVDGEAGWRICWAHLGERVVYTLSRRGVLVESSTDLEALKRRADEDRDEA